MNAMKATPTTSTAATTATTTAATTAATKATTKKTGTLWLVAHDLSPLGDGAARSAAVLAGDGARLRLLHITPLPLREPWDRDGKHTYAVEEEQRQMLRALAQTLRHERPGIDVDVEVIAGDATARIVEEAQRLGADYIVVGTHDRHGVSRLVLGSVAEAVVHKSDVPVLVVKHRAA